MTQAQAKEEEEEEEEAPMWEEISQEKGNMRFTIVTDWFSQTPDQTLPTSGAKVLCILANMASAEFGHKEIFRMDQPANRARVEAILEKASSSDEDKIVITLCKVTPEGTVLLGGKRKERRGKKTGDRSCSRQSKTV